MHIRLKLLAMRFTQGSGYWIAVTTSVSISVLVFLCARQPNANRGGAITVALSFLLLLPRNLGGSILDTIMELQPSIGRKLETAMRRVQSGERLPEFTSEETAFILYGLLSSARVSAEEQAKRDSALILSSIVGTIFWGFGDAWWQPVHQWLHLRTHA